MTSDRAEVPDAVPPTDADSPGEGLPMSDVGQWLVETPDVTAAFPRLEPPQIELLASHGERRPCAVGDVLVREGEPDPTFFLALNGLVAVVQGHDTPHQDVVRVHGAARFLGELGLLIGQVSFFSAVVAEPGEVLAVPVEELRALVTPDLGLGGKILRAYLIRRSLALGQGAGFRIIGSRYSTDTARLREFASPNRLPHRCQGEEIHRRVGFE